MRLRTKYPLIFSIAAIVGTVAVGVTTAKSTIKATKILEIAKDESEKDLTTKEKVELLAPVYIPPAFVCLATIACISGSYIFSSKQQASIISAYMLLDKTYKEYAKKVSERFGNEVDREIKEEIVKDQVTYFDCAPEEDLQLFYDEYTASYFESTMERVTEAQRAFNEAIRLQGSANLSLLYDLIDPSNLIDTSHNVLYLTQPSTFAEQIRFENYVTYINDDLECWIIRYA